MVKSPTKNTLLDSAQSIIARDGFANFTLESVAKHAQRSKGGLLHHFPTKDALIEALVLRAAQEWSDTCNAAQHLVEPGPAQFTRGILHHHLHDKEAWSAERRSMSSTILAALAQNPKLMTPIQSTCATIRSQILNDDLPPGIGHIIIAALDGLWLNWTLGFQDHNPQQHELTITTLQSILTQHAAPQPL